MDQTVEGMKHFIQASGLLAPILFILLHIFRQLFFIPVVVICLVGGYVFGFFYGTIFSIIGLTATSMFFYYIVHAFPTWLNTLSNMKQKWLGEKEDLTVIQIMVLRLMPFIHFHLISLYLIQISKNFKEYCRLSLYASIPPALLYTGFGNLMSEIPLAVGLGLLALLMTVFYLFRKKPLHEDWDEQVSVNQKA